MFIAFGLFPYCAIQKYNLKTNKHCAILHLAQVYNHDEVNMKRKHCGFQLRYDTSDRCVTNIKMVPHSTRNIYIRPRYVHCFLHFLLKPKPCNTHDIWSTHTRNEVNAAESTALVWHPPFTIHSSDPALLPLRVARKPVEGQCGPWSPPVPTTGHYACVNHIKATEFVDLFAFLP